MVQKMIAKLLFTFLSKNKRNLRKNHLCSVQDAVCVCFTELRLSNCVFIVLEL